LILICYDGSPDARCAVEQSGRLMPGQPATILTVWASFIDVLARAPSGFGVAPSIVDGEAIDQINREHAKERAEEGVALATQAGCNAQPRTCTLVTTVADAILSEAEAVHADAIVMGTRGLTGVKSVLIGSVSHAVIQHADRTVIIVPSPELSAARRHHRHRGDE
jgi:nucleotide-binding universal stress UspA family protein